jgi:Fe-Mn family superoxide dismutase
MDIRDTITLLEAKSKQDIEIIELSYSMNDLAPVMSSDSMKLHYGKLAHGYAQRFNNHEGDPEFNYAGAFLHNVFFPQFRESRNSNEPNGPIGGLIKTKFKSWDNFCDEFNEAALQIQGSGWCYLARDGSIKTIANHEVRDDILVLVDMWEHAYILDYGSNKAKYLTNIWKIINWNVINARWGKAYK